MTFIDMTVVKRNAFKLPEPIKTLILSEADTMEASEFISKIATWDRLVKMHSEAQR